MWARPFCGRGNEYFRGGDKFPAGAVVLADPGLVEAQVVEPLDQFQVPVYGQGGVFTHPVEGAKEYAKLHAFGKSHDFPSFHARVELLLCLVIPGWIRALL